MRPVPTDVERVVLAEAEAAGSDGTFDILVPSPDWYTLEVRSGESLGGVVAEQRLLAGPDPPDSTVVVPGEIVRCSLVDESGRAASFYSYAVTYAAGDEHASTDCGGFGGSEERLNFLWPTQAISVTVRVSGNAVCGSIELSGPNDPCLIQGRSNTSRHLAGR
jgi:hypothetical protein